MRNTCRLWSVLLLIATGCTYNPVRQDPCTGFQSGGGVCVSRGGPLDPWMLDCRSCLRNCCFLSCCDEHRECPPMTYSGTQCCPAPACPTPICPTPVCPTPVCPTSVCPTPTFGTPGVPLGPTTSPYAPLPANPQMMQPMMQMPAAPLQAPQGYGPAPTPTFAEPCANCNSSPSTGLPGYPQTFETPYHPQTLPHPGVSNYPQLFHAPPMAPPAQPRHGDQFLMPTPAIERELPPTADQLPPHYEQMEPPAGQPMPMNRPPMNPMAPMPQPAPMTNPMNTPSPAGQPMPMPQGTEASQTSHPRILPSSMTQQGVIPPGARQYDSRRQQWIPIRL